MLKESLWAFTGVMMATSHTAVSRYLEHFDVSHYFMFLCLNSYYWLLSCSREFDRAPINIMNALKSFNLFMTNSKMQTLQHHSNMIVGCRIDDK